MIMPKDNHIWSAGTILIIHLVYPVIPIPHGRGTGPITAAIARAREVGGFSLRLDVEVRNEDEANEAIAAGADIVMLDNIEGSELGSVARRLRERWSGEGKKFLLETSGGITEGNLRERAIAGKCTPHTRAAVARIDDHFVRVEIDVLSTSAVHQSVPHIDFSLKIQKPPT
jgi:nicotinate-nucleotide pyrophosphorylase (carboxylating)